MLDRLELLLAAEVQRIAQDMRAADEPIGLSRDESNVWRVTHPLASYVAPAFRRLQAVRAKLVELGRE